MKPILLLIVIISASLASTADAFNYEPKRAHWLLPALTTLGIDYLQTMDIATRNDKRENNILLGDNPTPRAVNTYFLFVTIIIIETAYLLPEKLGACLLAMVTFTEIAYIQHNSNLGVRFEF